MGKLITIDYEEYLELERLKKAFNNLKYGFQQGKRDEMCDIWIWEMEGQSEIFDLIGENSMCPDIDRYARILIKK